MKRETVTLSGTLTILVTLYFAGAHSRAVDAQTTPPRISTKLSLITTKVQRGRSVRATVVIDIPRGYHINSHEPVSRFALPTKIDVEAPSGIRIGAISYPRAVVRRFTFSEPRLGVYENRAVIRFIVTIPPNQQIGKSEIKARLSYQSCSDEVCFPPANSELSVSLEVLCERD